MIGPRLAEAAITAVEKPRPYFFLSSGPSVDASGMPSRPATRKNAMTHQLIGLAVKTKSGRDHVFSQRSESWKQTWPVPVFGGRSFDGHHGSHRLAPQELDEMEEAVCRR